MTWDKAFPRENQPDLAQVTAYIRSPLWEKLLIHLTETYGCKPKLTFSGCSLAPGWNLKFRKSGRALCTLYPAAEHFSCLVSVGTKEAAEAELLLPAFPAALQELYAGTPPLNGARWLMVDVTTQETLDAVQALIALRVPRKE